MTIFGKAATGIRWSSVSQAARQLMQFATMIVLARLLAPADFGLVGMATVVSGFVALFKDLGTSAAVIQKENISNELLVSIFWVNAVFGIITTVILFALAPLIASFYHEPRVILILRALSVTFCISGFSIMQQALLERGLAFNVLARLEIIATAIGSTVGIGTALLGAGVWCLVYQSIAIVAVTTGQLWLSADWKPRWTFHWQEVKAVSGYSLNLSWNFYRIHVKSVNICV